MIEADAGSRSAVTVAQRLINIMKRLKNCSENVSGHPGTGMDIAYRSLIETACEPQTNAGKLVEISTGYQ